MIRIERGNAWGEMFGAPTWFRDYAARHLSVPVEAGVDKRGTKFSYIWWHEGKPYGSLVHGTRFAAGLTPHVLQLARHYKLPATLQDVRDVVDPSSPLRSVSASWRPYQDEIHAKLLKSPTGVINAVPRSGKTLMAARIIDELGLPVLYVAPSVQIVRQTYQVLVKHFGHDAVGRLDGEADEHEKDISRLIVVATTNSAVKQSQEWFDTRKMLIVDEFHHSASETIHRINDLARFAYYRYGFTGTHYRSGFDNLAMEAICSQVLQRVGVDDLVRDGYLAKPNVVFLKPKADRITADSFATAYSRGIVKSEKRNACVAEITRKLAHELHIPTIVLVKQRAHADALGKLIQDSVVVKGGESALTSAAVKDFADRKIPVLIGTTVIGEGVDVPAAGALVYASGGSSGVLMMQSYYRPLTANPGKTEGWIYDFTDDHHAMLLRHSRKRSSFAARQLNTETRHA